MQRIAVKDERLKKINASRIKLNIRAKFPKNHRKDLIKH